jgi:hypothetical protein
MSTVEEVVDLEEFAKAGKKPPQAKSYVLRIDKLKYTVQVSHMKGREILALASKTPVERFKLFQQLHGGSQPKRIELDDDVDFTTPGIEKFKTLPIDSTDGLAETRRQFRLPEFDEAFLDSFGLRWEALIDQGAKWVIIYGYTVPAGYNARAVDLALRIAPDYPTAQIDMVYFAPNLSRADGKAIANLSAQALDQRTFQQWSRHRTAQNPWRVGEDDLQTHMLLVEHWLQHELTR